MQRRIAKQLRRINRWAGLLGLLLGIISIIIGLGVALWSLHESERIVERSGGFKQSDLSLGVGNCRFGAETPSTVVIGTTFDTPIVTLLLTVSNIGSVGSRALVITTNSPIGHDFVERVGALKWKRDNPAEAVINVSESHSIHGIQLLSTFAISALPPGGTVTIALPMPYDFETLSKSVPPEHATCVDIIQNNVLVGIQQEADSPRSFQIHPIVCKADALTDLKNAMTRIIINQQVDTRLRLSRSGYLRMLLSQRKNTLYGEFVQAAKDSGDHQLVGGFCVLFPVSHWRLLLPFVGVPRPNFDTTVSQRQRTVPANRSK